MLTCTHCVVLLTEMTPEQLTIGSRCSKHIVVRLLLGERLRRTKNTNNAPPQLHYISTDSRTQDLLDRCTVRASPTAAAAAMQVARLLCDIVARSTSASHTSSNALYIRAQALSNKLRGTSSGLWRGALLLATASPPSGAELGMATQECPAPSRPPRICSWATKHSRPTS